MVLNFYQGFCWLYKDSWNWNFFLRWCNSIPETGDNWIKKFIFGCLFSAFRIKTYSCQVIFIVKVIYWRSYRHIYFSLKFFCFFTIYKKSIFIIPVTVLCFQYVFTQNVCLYVSWKMFSSQIRWIWKVVLYSLTYM